MGDSTNTMKCPFRQNELGEFCDCYKEKCMAYYEDMYVHTASEYLHSPIPRETPALVCRRMPSLVPYA